MLIREHDVVSIDTEGDFYFIFIYFPKQDVLEREKSFLDVTKRKLKFKVYFEPMN